MLALRPQNGSLLHRIGPIPEAASESPLVPSFVESAVKADAGFWGAVADVALEFSDGAESPADLRALDVVVPAWPLAAPVRAALHDRLLRAGHRCVLLPRFFTPVSWAGDPVQDSLQRRVEMFGVLRENRWIRTTFGEQPAALWTLAARVTELCDELTLAAVDGADAFEARLQASLARHYRRRAVQPLQPQAQLILQLWRAGMAHPTGAGTWLGALRSRSRETRRPMLFVAAGRIEPWTRAWLQALGERVPVRLVGADVPAAVADRPLLAASWPELAGRRPEAGVIAARASALGAAQAHASPTLVEAKSLEEQALVVAEQVLAWLGEPGGTEPGQAPIALVAIDRVAARRVRALLERAQVLVRDETGWKLSTTSAAGALMRWLDLALDGFHHRDLLDWLKSPFTLHGVPGKRRLVETVEKAIRRHGVVQGLGGLFVALDETEPAYAPEDRAQVRAVLVLLESLATRLAGGPAPAADRLRDLEQALHALGMRPALAADAVGRAVLREIDDLRHRFESTPVGSTLLAADELRALVADRFEEAGTDPDAIESPVVMVSLAGAALRDFRAAVLIGVDGERLPALPADLLFFSAAVRADLGLKGPREAVRDQGLDLASLLVRVPRVVATWSSREGDEPRPLAAWFARLRAVATWAGHDPLHAAGAATWRVASEPLPAPAPQWSARLPPRVSATQYQSLVDCAYQYYARHLLGLRPLDEVPEEPDAGDYGKAVHEVLARFHRQWAQTPLHEADPRALADSLGAHAAAVFDPLVARFPRFLAQRQQFVDVQRAYLDWAAGRSRAGWRFVAAEERCESTLSFDAGGVRHQVALVGRLDRIDRHAARDRLELLDYKSTEADALAKRLRVAGEDVQLPFYGLLLAPQPADAAYVALPRKDEGGPVVQEVRPAQEFGPLVEALRVRLLGDLQRIAGGAPLPAIGADATCKRCEMRGLCRRDHWSARSGDA
jgi:ATP-dependent helicase/nuclease subunit B